jgi:hypothetical protein
MPWPNVPLRAVKMTSGWSSSSECSISVASPGVAVACMSHVVTSLARTLSSAAFIASCGPPFDGVMMWCASEEVPTPTISIPSGRNPSRIIASASPTIHTQEPPATCVPLSPVSGRDTSASAETTFAL